MIVSKSLFVVCALAALAAPRSSVNVGAAACPTMPTLVLPEVGVCQCAPKVEDFRTGGGNIPSCVHGGSSQPCFHFWVETVDDAIHTPGDCFFEPPPPQAGCPGPTKSCSFAPLSVSVRAAACAQGSAGCGGPFQLYNSSGEKVGQPFGNGEVRRTTLAPGNQSCGKKGGYTFEIQNPGGAVVWTHKVEANCCNCKTIVPGTGCSVDG